MEGTSVRVGQVRVDLGKVSSSERMLKNRSFKEDWGESEEVERALRAGRKYGELHEAFETLFKTMRGEMPHWNVDRPDLRVTRL